MGTHPMDEVFLRLWSKAVGTADYVKAEWKELQRGVINPFCYGGGNGANVGCAECAREVGLLGGSNTGLCRVHVGELRRARMEAESVVGEIEDILMEAGFAYEADGHETEPPRTNEIPDIVRGLILTAFVHEGDLE